MTSERTRNLGEYFGLDMSTTRAPNLPRIDHVVFVANTTLPRIGRLIHVRGYDKCRAAIVTGESSLLGQKQIFVEIFAPNLKPQEAVLYVDGEWHYVDECTDLV